MKKTLLYVLAGAFAVSGVAETTPLRASESGPAAPRTLEQLRAEVYAQGMASLASGDVEQVRHRRWHRGRHYNRRYRYRGRWVPRRYTLRYIHRRGRWCGKWVGRRCYYTPRPLRPLRRALR